MLTLQIPFAMGSWRNEVCKLQHWCAISLYLTKKVLLTFYECFLSPYFQIFLEKNQKFIKNGCNFKRISTDLLQLRVIDKSQLNKLLHSDILEANQHMYLILESDLSPPKLSKVAEALEGDTTHDGHQDLACRIRECLCECTYVPVV